MRDAFALDQAQDPLGVENRQGEADGASHEAGHPTGLVAEAVEERRGDHVAVPVVEAEVIGEDLVAPERGAVAQHDALGHPRGP